MKVVELLIVNVTQHTSLVEVMERGEGFRVGGIILCRADDRDPSLRVVFER